MTDPSGIRENYLALGIQSGLETGFASGNSQLFPGPPESLEPDSFPCCPRDQSLFVNYVSILHRFEDIST